MKSKFERLLDLVWAGTDDWTTATFHFSSLDEFVWNEFYEQIYNTKKYNRNIIIVLISRHMSLL
jgi:hypothetical protein